MRHWLLSGTCLRTLPAGVVYAGMCAISPALALPQGGVVSGGAAQIAASGAVLQVDQSTDRAVIDWTSFNIAPGETTRFQQPSASSAILNRIHDQDPSQILGNLSANGIVALVNPNGMVFGQGSRIDVGSLIATTVDIPNERFLTGQSLLFGQPGETDAAVVNQGTVSVDEGGLVALVAPQVTNTGVIQAKAGRVALGAGEVFTVDLYGDGLISLAASARLNEVVLEQDGGIRAEGGTVLLTTAEARRVMDQAINMDGWVDVSSLTQEAGSIVLHAAQGTANVTGKLHADGAVGLGGRLQITGEHVKVGAGAMLTALGTYGGGDVKIGGDYLGGGTTPRARTTKIESGATIDASANASGKGGRVIVWSDERTEFGGLIKVKGGLLSGDGGFVETSSKEVLRAHGLVDASSPRGKGGEWLLDPNNITINTTADTNVAGAPNYTTTNDNAVVTVASIQAALNAGTSVSITTGTAGGNSQSGDITVASAISKTAGGDASLSLIAHNNITLNAGISSASGALDVTLWSDAVTPNGAGRILLTNANITTNGGDVVMGGGADPAANPAIGTAQNGVELNNSDIITGAGNISLRGQGEAAGANNRGVVIRNTSVVQTTMGNITIVGQGGGATTDNYGVWIADAGTSVSTADGDIDITGTGGNGTNENDGIYLSSGARIESTGIGAGAGTITLTGTSGNGTGTFNDGMEIDGDIVSVAGDITLIGSSTGAGSTNRGIIMYGAGTAITSTGTGANAADISLTGTGSDNGTDSNYGIAFGDGVISAVDGDILLNGTGGDGSADSNYGIKLSDGAEINSTGTGASAGTITFDGTGGDGTEDNYGIYLTGAGTEITAVDGDIELDGTGGDGTTGGNGGIFIEEGSITSTGNTADGARISLTGAGGASPTGAGIGIWFDGDILISSGYGDITFLGTGAAGAANLNSGIDFDGDVLIESTGTGADAGNISITGTGGAGTSENYGVYLQNAGVEITTVDGNIALTGTGGNGSENDNDGIKLLTDIDILSTGDGTISLTGAEGAGTSVGIEVGGGTNVIGGGAADGNITLTANTVTLANLSVETTEDITIKPRTAGTTVGLAGGAGTLDLSTAELDMLDAGDKLILGRADGTGAITVNAYANWANIAGTGIQFLSDTGVLSINGAQTIGARDLTITTNANTVVGAGVTGTGTLTLETTSAGTTMGLAGAAGTVNYLAAELTNLGTGWTLWNIGSTAQTGTLILGARSWDDPVTFLSAAAGNITVSGAQTAGAASNAAFIFDAPTTLAANVDTSNATGGTQDITFNDDITLTGNAQVLAGNGDISFAGTIDGVFDLTLSAAGSITLADDVGAGTALDDLTITSDADPTIGGTVAGTGILTLQQASNATTMGVAGGAGALNYSLADLAALGTGWTSLRFGSTTATGTLTVGANAWDSPVTYRSAAAGSIVISGAQTAGAASDTTFTFSGPTTLGANVSTAAATGGTQDIAFNDDVTLTANAQVLAGNGDLSFAGTIDGAFDLTLSAAGTLTLADDIGAGTPLDDLTISSDADPTIGGAVEGTGILTLQQASNATTMGVAGGAGALNYSLADLAGLGTNWTSLRFGSSTATGALTVGANAWDLPVEYRSAAAGSIVISGAQTAVAASDASFTFSGPVALNAGVSTSGATGGTGAILFSDDVTLGANVTVNAGTGGTITFSDIVNGAQDLTLSAGGAITLNGVVGGVTPLDDLTITSDANPAINANVSGGGTLTLDTLSAGTTMGLGGGAGTVNYSAAEQGRFGSGWTLINIGNTAQTGATTVGAVSWSDPVHFRANAAGSVIISGAQTAGAASDTTFTFTGPTSLAANVDTTNATGGTQDITFNNAATLTANAQVLAGNGDITFASTIDGAFDLTLNAAGAITLTSNVGGTTPLDDLTLTSDADPTIGGSVAGAGVLILQQKSNATTMGVAGGAGTLNYSTAELAGLGVGWSTIRLGSTTATGALTVGANAWASPVEYRSAAGGSIVISGAQTAVAASDASFTFSGPTSLGANVSTVGATGGTRDITFSDDVTLTGNAQVLAGGGDILFSGTLDGAFDLTLNSTGAITLADDVGAGTALDDLTITSDADPTIGGTVDGTGILTLQQASNATTMGVAGAAGALNYSLADLAGLGANWTSIRLGSPTATGALTVGANAWDVPVEYRAAAAGSIVITGAQTAGAASDASFTFSGPTTLGANVSTVGATGGTQDITFNDDVTLTVNAQVLAGNGDLAFAGTIDGAFDLVLSAAGTIILADDVGAGTPLDDLTISSDADPTIGGAVEGTGILTLQQTSNATAMGVAGGAGALNYSLADLAGLGANWTVVRLGGPTATGTLTVGAQAWDIPVDYRAAAAGSIVIAGAQTAGAASDTIFTFSGPATINALLDLSNATGGTQAITFNDAATVNADITSGGGDIAFNDTLSLNADIATGGGEITLADDVTLTGISSIDTDITDIGFDGTLDGTFDLTLSTTGDVDFSDDVGAGTALDDLAIAGAADVTFAGALSAASFTLTGGTGAVLVTDAADITNNLGITTTGTVTFDDALAFDGDMTIDSGASAIAFNGTVDGPGNADLTTTADITFGDDVGSGVTLGDIALTNAADVTFSGELNAASLALTGGTGVVMVTGVSDITNDIGITTTGTVTFGSNLVYGGAVVVDAGASAIAFNGTVDGPGDFELTTTNDITFGDDVGAATRLGDVMLDPQHVAAIGVFNVGSFTLVNGTGNVSFLGLDATGDISIDTDGNITGTYAGADGMLEAGTGSITATVSFATLDIAGAAATLSDGYIGAPGVADQTMANLISIGGVSYPVLVPDPAYTFAAFIIGASPPAPPGGGGGGGGAGGGRTPPVLPPDPGTGPVPVTPPVTEPGGGPMTPAPETSFDPLLFDIARLQCSAQRMVQSAKLPPASGCDAASTYASWDALLQSR